MSDQIFTLLVPMFALELTTSTSNLHVMFKFCSSFEIVEIIVKESDFLFRYFFFPICSYLTLERKGQ